MALFEKSANVAKKSVDNVLGKEMGKKYKKTRDSLPHKWERPIEKVK